MLKLRRHVPAFSLACLVACATAVAPAGATDAVNLDGGGSSTLVERQPDGSYKVINIPIHERVPGRERPVVNAVGVGNF